MYCAYLYQFWVGPISIFLDQIHCWKHFYFVLLNLNLIVHHLIQRKLMEGVTAFWLHLFSGF